MKNHVQKVLTTGLVLLGIGAFAVRAQAATTDTMTVSVSPTVTYGVTISSPYASGYNFGNVALAATTMSTLAIVLNTTGATGPEYFGLSISNTSGGWTSTVGSPAQDQFRMSAKIAASQPLASNTTHYLSAGPFAGAAEMLYSQTMTPVAGTANVWLKLEMPPTLNAGTTGAQTMTLTATAQGS